MDIERGICKNESYVDEWDEKILTKELKQKCEKARNKTSKPVKGRAQNNNQFGTKSRIVNKDQDRKQELEQEEKKRGSSQAST